MLIVVDAERESEARSALEQQIPRDLAVFGLEFTADPIQGHGGDLETSCGGQRTGQGQGDEQGGRESVWHAAILLSIIWASAIRLVMQLGSPCLDDNWISVTPL